MSWMLFDGERVADVEVFGQTLGGRDEPALLIALAASDWERPRRHRWARDCLMRRHEASGLILSSRLRAAVKPPANPRDTACMTADRNRARHARDLCGGPASLRGN